MFEAWGRIIFNRRRLVLVVAAAGVVCAAIWGTGVFGKLQSAGGFAPPASQSQQEANRASAVFGRDAGDVVLLYSSAAQTVHSPAYRAAVTSSLARLLGLFSILVALAMIGRRQEMVAAVEAITHNPTQLLLIGNAWTRLDLGVFALSVVSLVIAVRFLPKVGAHAHEGPPERSSFHVVRRDTVFLLFVGSSVLASAVSISPIENPVNCRSTCGSMVRSSVNSRRKAWTSQLASSARRFSVSLSIRS